MRTALVLPLRMRTALVLPLPAKNMNTRKNCACQCSVIGSFILYLVWLWCLGVLICFHLKEVMYNSASYIAILIVMVMNLKPLPLIVAWSSLPSPSLAMQVFILAYQKNTLVIKFSLELFKLFIAKVKDFEKKCQNL